MACEETNCTVCHDATGCLVMALQQATRDLADADAEVEFLSATLASVLEYVTCGWDQMPQALVEDIDAALDGNVEDIA